MNYADEEKRAFCVGYIIEYLNTLDTWPKFCAFINEVTPAKIKSKLKKGWQDAQLQDDIVIASAQEKKSKDKKMELEIDNL